MVRRPLPRTASDPQPTPGRARRSARFGTTGRAATRSAPREPITVDRILATAFTLVEADGFEALTMRRVAAALDTGPASLYAHVRNKADLDDLLIGELCARVRLPEPDPARWREQFRDVCAQLRDEFLRFPGISQAALGTAPGNLDALSVSEGLLGLALAGGVDVQRAAWAIDAAFLYVAGYSFEASLRRRPGEDDARVRERPAIAERLRSLPAEHFPLTVAHAEQLTAGVGHDRFDFTLDLLLRGLEPA